MKARRVTVDYLRDILDAIDRAERFTRGMSFDQFRADDKTVFAVVRALEIIGEATKNVSVTVRRRHTEVPWKEMAGIRDKLIHGYFGVNEAVVWKTVQQDLPSLKPMIGRIFEEADNGTKGDAG